MMNMRKRKRESKRMRAGSNKNPIETSKTERTEGSEDRFTKMKTEKEKTRPKQPDPNIMNN